MDVPVSGMAIGRHGKIVFPCEGFQKTDELSHPAPGNHDVLTDLVRSELVNRLGHVSSGFPKLLTVFQPGCGTEFKGSLTGADFLHSFRLFSREPLVSVHFNQEQSACAPWDRKPQFFPTQSIQVLSMNSSAVGTILLRMISETVSTVAEAVSKKAIMVLR